MIWTGFQIALTQLIKKKRRYSLLYACLMFSKRSRVSLYKSDALFSCLLFFFFFLISISYSAMSREIFESPKQNKHIRWKRDRIDLDRWCYLSYVVKKRPTKNDGFQLCCALVIAIVFFFVFIHFNFQQIFIYFNNFHQVTFHHLSRFVYHLAIPLLAHVISYNHIVSHYKHAANGACKCQTNKTSRFLTRTLILLRSFLSLFIFIIFFFQFIFVSFFFFLCCMALHSFSRAYERNA